MATEVETLRLSLRAGPHHQSMGSKLRNVFGAASLDEGARKDNGA